MSAMMPARAELPSTAVLQSVANSMARLQKPQTGASRYTIAPHIAHINIDGFFAAVEQAQRPRFQGKPLLVAQQRVISASYEAKLLGISTGMSIEQARVLCPNAIVLAGNYARYAEYAERLFAILKTFTPAVDPDAQLGFYLNFFGSALLDCDFPNALRRVQLEVLKQTGLSVSIGAAKTKVAAAAASRFERPRGLRILAPGTEAEFLATLPVECLHGNGAIDTASLRKRGVCSVAELRRVPFFSLQSAYGDVLGRQIWHNARGLDHRETPPGSLARSLSREAHIDGGTIDIHQLNALAEFLCARISIALRDSRRSAGSIGVLIRYADQFSASQSRRLPDATGAPRELLRSAVSLLQLLFTRPNVVHALTVSVNSVSSTSSDCHFQQTARSAFA
jgi:DNA polymerase-4